MIFYANKIKLMKSSIAEESERFIFIIKNIHNAGLLKPFW